MSLIVRTTAPAPTAVSGYRARRGDIKSAALFLMPNFLGFLVFVAFPIVFSLALVFTNWSLKPAIETEIIGFDNIRTLVGFERLPNAPAHATAIGAGFAAGWLLLLWGVLQSVVAMVRRMDGVRAGGWIAIATGIGVLAHCIATQSAVGWALFAITWAMGGMFLVLTDEQRPMGAGFIGPVLVLAGMFAVRALDAPFLARFQALDPLFWKYTGNTFYLMFLIPLQIAGALGLALALSKPIMKRAPVRAPMLAGVCGALALGGMAALWVAGSPDAGVLWATFFGIAALGAAFGVVAFRTVFFLPSFTAGVAIMLLWKQMFNPTFGPLNEFLRPALGVLGGLVGLEIEPPAWILDPHWAKPSLILMGFWTLVGGTNMLIYLAGLANIPEQLYEAARIDGASRLQEFRHVTWPQLAPTTFFIVIMSVIAGLQGGFEQARVMTAGGPAGATKTLSYYIYERAFQDMSLGYASAIAWVMFVLIFLVTALNWKFGNQYVND